MAKKTSKAPSGQAIARSGAKFTFSWKTGETYKSQTLQYKVATSFNTNGTPKYPSKWTDKSIGKKATSVSISANNCAAVYFRVKGQASGKKVSAWAEKDFINYVPNTLSVSMSVVNDYTSSFSWKTETSDTSNRPFVRHEWQTALIANSNTDNGNDVKSGWSGVNNNNASEGSWLKEETGWDTVKNSMTRWIKVRSVGWAGLASAWKYSKRVYASPKPATNVYAKREPFSNSGYSVTVTWNSPETYDRPIDVVNVEYAQATPVVTVEYPADPNGTVVMNMSCPTSGVSWNSVVDAGGVGGARTVAFADSSAVSEDNCFYVTVANKHDNNITRSTPVLADGGAGKIVDPSAPIGVVSQSNPRLYTVSVPNRNTSITNAAIAIYFRSSSQQNNITCIGVVPPAEGSTTCMIPEFPTGDTISFGARTFVGSYTPLRPLTYTEVSNPTGNPSEQGYYELVNNIYILSEDTSVDAQKTYYIGTSSDVTLFDIDMKMSSSMVWGAGVPLPPTVTAEPAGETTIQVTWNQSWADATEAELSWADHEDAWSSTDEPQTYIVPRVNAGAWKIAGLSVGTWYVRVRLIKTVGESSSYSAYSAIQTVKLASSPDIPSLLLSSGVVSKTGSVTCYWAYVSGDGTGQKQAQIYEAFPEYTAVSNPSGDPYENAYYEKTEDNKYVRSFDRTVVSGKTYYQTTGTMTYSTNPLRTTESAQHITLENVYESFGWDSGETHHLAVKVISMSGESSDGLSTPVAVSIADELHISIVSSSLTYVNVPSDYNLNDEVTDYRRAFSMTEFPLTFNIDGYEAGNSVTCIIDRAETYKVDKPDESEYEGFKGETILMKTYNSSTITINKNDLIGSFDDTASYSVTMILNDAYGQNAVATRIPTGTYTEVEDPAGSPIDNEYYELVNNVYILSTDTEVDEQKTYYSKDEVDSFEIHWSHQAIMPEATIEIDRTNNVTMISPELPESGYLSGDTVDIYRLSADPPELIYEGALLTDPPTKYVDPYPAFGDFGGHRIVYRTYNGDYITEDNELAMTDYVADENPEYKHTTFGIVIDFDGHQLILPGNVSFSNKWNKDFTVTKYLGGAVQGDWNPAVERTMSANTTIPVEVNPENIEAIRRLAVYSGICHVRTPDGSSFAANINVNDDREEKWTTRLAKISLDITRCDSERFDGMTYAEWLEEQS